MARYSSTRNVSRSWISGEITTEHVKVATQALARRLAHAFPFFDQTPPERYLLGQERRQMPETHSSSMGGSASK